MNTCGSKSPSQRKQKERKLSSSLNASKTFKECGLNSVVYSFSILSYQKARHDR